MEYFWVTYLQNNFGSEPELHEGNVSKADLIALLKRADVSIRDARLVYRPEREV